MSIEQMMDAEVDVKFLMTWMVSDCALSSRLPTHYLVVIRTCLKLFATWSRTFHLSAMH